VLPATRLTSLHRNGHKPDHAAESSPTRGMLAIVSSFKFARAKAIRSAPQPQEGHHFIGTDTNRTMRRNRPQPAACWPSYRVSNLPGQRRSPGMISQNTHSFCAFHRASNEFSNRNFNRTETPPPGCSPATGRTSLHRNGHKPDQAAESSPTRGMLAIVSSFKFARAKAIPRNDFTKHAFFLRFPQSLERIFEPQF
jgi:hypothetical protein